jgi:hypothetical protein
MRYADDQRCDANAVSSERAGRTAPGTCIVRNRPPATATETVEQTTVHGHEQAQRRAVPQLRNDGQGCLPHAWWGDAALAVAHRDARVSRVKSLKSACAPSNHRSSASRSAARSLNIKSRSTGPSVRRSGKR